MQKTKKYKIIFILLTLLFQYGNAVVNLFLDPNNKTNNQLNEESLIDCVVDLTQITVDFAPTILILENNHDDSDDSFFNKMIETFADRNIAIATQDKNNHKISKTDDVFEENVIIIAHFDSYKCLLNFSIHDVDKRVKHLIIIPEYTTETFILLQQFGRMYIERDVTFIIQSSTGDHSVETFIPVVNEKTCKLEDEVQPIQINLCNNGSLKTNIVYPEEHRVDLKNCFFKVGMATMFPFSVIPNRDQLKNYDILDEYYGSDTEIMKIIAKYFNALPEWHYIDRAEESPYEDLEYLDYVINGSLDACAGGLYRIYGDIVSYSGIYTRQSVIWIYANHRACRSWVNLVHKVHGMYLFLIYYVTYSILSYLFRKYDFERSQLKDIFFNSWGALIGASGLPQPTSLKHKILDMFYLISSLYLSAYMSMQLFNFLTIDRPGAIFKTNDEILDSGRNVYLNPKYKHFVKEEKYIAFANTSEDCGDFSDCVNISLANNGLTIILDEYFWSMQAASAVNDEARMLRPSQNILTIYQEMLISKDSLLEKGIQNALNRLFEAGICEKLFKEAVGINVVARAESANKNAISNSYSCESGCAISLAQVAGVFYVWIIGTLFSVCVFVFEIMWKRQRVFGQVIECAVPIQIVTMKVKGQAPTLKPMVNTIIPNMDSLFGRRKDYPQIHRNSRTYKSFNDEVMNDLIAGPSLPGLSDESDEKAINEILENMYVGPIDDDYDYGRIEEEKLKSLIDRLEGIPEISGKEPNTFKSADEIQKYKVKHKRWKHSKQDKASAIIRKVKKMLHDSKYFRIIDLVDDEKIEKLDYQKRMRGVQNELKFENAKLINGHNYESDLTYSDENTDNATKKPIILIDIFIPN